MSISRVLEFEKELLNSINDISQIELQLDSINEMRSRLFQFEETISNLTFEQFRKRVEILELETAILKSNMILEDFHSGGCYEEIALQKLINSSKKDHTTKESNDHLIRMRINNTLQNSISYHQELIEKSKLIQNKFDQLRIELQTTRDSNENNLHQILTTYTRDINSNIQKSTLISRQVMEDSLILRHNCRIATDLLTQKRLGIVEKRKDLQDTLKNLQQNVEETLKNFEVSYTNEIEMKLQPKRKQVMKLEDYLENIRSISSDLRLKYQNEINHYKNTNKLIKYNYESLQNNRKEEILQRQSELQELKNGILRAESTLFNPQSAYFIQFPTHLSSENHMTNYSPHITPKKNTKKTKQSKIKIKSRY